MNSTNNPTGSVFEDAVEIGRGASGSAFIAKYIGNDPDILQFAHNGLVLYKTLHNDNDLEAKREQAIANHLGNGVNNVTMTPRCKTIMDNGKEKTVMEFIAYSNQIDPNTNLPFSFDLDKFLKNSAKSIDPDQPQIGGMNLKAAMHTIFQNIATAQDQLHAAGVLHLDSACRNFMVDSNLNLKIIDFGRSERFQPAIDANYGIFPLRDPSTTPLLITDKMGLAHKQSIATDLYARRMAMIEAMSMVLGVSLLDVSTLRVSNLNQQERGILDNAYQANQIPRPPSTPGVDNENRPLSMQELTWVRAMSNAKDDRYMLSHSLDTLRDKAAKRNDALGQQMCAVIDAYHDYIVRLPLQKEYRFTPGVINLMRNMDKTSLANNSAKLDLTVTAPTVSATNSTATSSTTISAPPSTPNDGYAKAPAPQKMAKSSSSNILGTLKNTNLPNAGASFVFPPPPPPIVQQQSIEDALNQKHIALVQKALQLECAKQAHLEVVVDMQKVITSPGNSNAKITRLINLADEEMQYAVKFRSKDPRDAFEFRQLMKIIASGNPDTLKQRVESVETILAKTNENEAAPLKRDNTPSKRI